MIGRLFHRGVLLRMGSGEIRAGSAQALRLSLAGHVGVSSARMAELGALGDRALGARAAALDDLASRLAAELARPGADPAALLARLHDGDTPVDRQWADALAAARQWDAAHAPYQRAVLEALVEHVGGERECVRTLLANRGRGGGPAAADADSGLRQRLILDPATLTGTATEALEFNRMPKGDPLEIAIDRSQALEIMLAQHRFLVVCGVPWLLVDDTGEDSRMKLGRNMVGRSTDCDVVVHESYRAVSRRHVVLETRGTEAVVITDLSSLGTFVPRGYLDNRLH